MFSMYLCFGCRNVKGIIILSIMDMNHPQMQATSRALSTNALFNNALVLAAGTSRAA
jgi:hypothetical protein